MFIRLLWSPRPGLKTVGSLWQIADATSGKSAAELEQVFRFPDDKQAGNITKYEAHQSYVLSYVRS